LKFIRILDGLGADVSRRVPSRCATGEQPCSDGVSCSSGGSCLADLSASAPLQPPPPPPPTVALLTTTELGAFVNVRKGTSYAVCAAGVQPTAEAPCELGAVSISTPLDFMDPN
jgi:hypothetical protein